MFCLLGSDTQQHFDVAAQMIDAVCGGLCSARCLGEDEGAVAMLTVFSALLTSLALRYQIGVLQRGSRTRLRPADRLLWPRTPRSDGRFNRRQTVAWSPSPTWRDSIT